MADKKIKVKIDVEANTEPSIAQLKALKKELKNTAAGSDEFKKLYNQIDDLEDKIKSAKGVSADWIDSLESAGGPLGALGKGLNSLKVSTQSFGAALKATGIGLITAAIAGLVGAFAETDGAMKKLEPLFIAFQKILGGIFEALTPLIDGFIDLATQALPYITKGVKVFYSSLVALFTLVKEGGGGIAKILKGIFTLDKKEIEEGYKQLSGTWAKTVQAFDKTGEAFDKGYAKRTKTEKENADKAREILLKKLEAQDKYDEAILDKLKASALAAADTEQQKLDVEKVFADKIYQLKLDELNKKLKLYSKDSAEYKSIQAEKIKLEADYTNQLKDLSDKQEKITLDEIKSDKDAALALAKTEQEKLDIEEKYAKQTYDKKKELLKGNVEALGKLDEDRLNELAAFKVKQDKISEDELKATRDFNDKRDLIFAQSIKNQTGKAKAEREAKYKKDLEDLQADKEFIKLSSEEKFELEDALLRTKNNDLAKIEDDAAVAAHDKKLRALELEQQGLIEGTMSYFENKKAILDENYSKELDANKAQYNQGLIDLDEFEKNKAIIEAKYVKQSTDLQKAKFDQYLQYATQVLGALNNTLTQASSVMKMQQEQDIQDAQGNTEKIEEIKKKAFEDNKKMQIAQAIIGTLQSAVQAYQSLAVIPVVGPALGAVAAAAALVFGYKQVALIKAQKYESSSAASAGETASAPTAPAPVAPGVVGMQAPQIQTGQGANPTTQLGQTLTSAQKPLRAYVVSQDIQSQTALDRRTNRAATFSGG